MVFEFVCYDRTACWQTLADELRSRQLAYRCVDENIPNQWFRLDIDGIGWSDVKQFNTVQNMYRHNVLRMVWPVQARAG